MRTEQQLNAIALPESDDPVDQELVRWFALHGGGWSGTAAELFAAVKNRQILRSLGMDVFLHQGYPRMVSLQSCQDARPTRKPPSGTSRVIRPAGPQILSRLPMTRKRAPILVRM